MFFNILSIHAIFQMRLWRRHGRPSLHRRGGWPSGAGGHRRCGTGGLRWRSQRWLGKTGKRAKVARKMWIVVGKIVIFMGFK